MTNKRSKLIEMLEHLIADTEWSDIVDLTPQDAKDILALLKEQKVVEPILKRESYNKYYNYYVCPCCGDEVVYEQNYCSECGVKFTWEGR